MVFATVLADSHRIHTDHVQARLLSEVAEVAPNSSFWVGLHFTIRPGWHTYWLNPGDSGLAARIDWELPEGMVAGEIRWPIPRRFRIGHLMNYGYADEVVLLTRMSAWPPIRTTSSVVMAANVNWLVCEDICIPEKGRFELRLAVARGAPASDAEGRALIGKYLRLLPAPAPERAHFRTTPEVIRLRVPLSRDWTLEPSDVWFYAERYGVVDHAAPQSAKAGGNSFELTLARGELKHESLEQLRGVLVLRYGKGDTRGISVDAQPD